MGKRLPAIRTRRLESLREVVNEVAAPVASESARPIARIRLAWQRVCGPVLGGHTDPIRLEDKTLFIAADGHQWAKAFTDFEEQLLRDMRTTYPSISALSVVVVPRPNMGSHAAQPRPAALPHPDNEGIVHPGLRAACDGLAELRDGLRDKFKKDTQI